MCMSATTPIERPGEGVAAQPAHQLELELDDFTWQALAQESETMGVAVTELAAFAIAYYLADVDSGRVARQMPASLRRPAPSAI